MWRRYIFLCTLGAAAGVMVIPLNPVNAMFLRMAWLGMIAAAWGGLLVLWWRRQGLRIGLLVLPVLAAVPLLLPTGTIDAAELRDAYVRRMAALNGTKYIWGGESPRGIDCSGLPRRALREALFAYGLRHACGSAFRAGLEHWWFDASARALGEGYRDYTRPLGQTGIIRTLDCAGLLPGDLAVTTSGMHVLAYAGAGQWIQADPGIGAVAMLDGRTADNVWFGVPVTLHRWRLLEPR